MYFGGQAQQRNTFYLLKKRPTYQFHLNELEFSLYFDIFTACPCCQIALPDRSFFRCFDSSKSPDLPRRTQRLLDYSCLNHLVCYCVTLLNIKQSFKTQKLQMNQNIVTDGGQR